MDTNKSDEIESSEQRKNKYEWKADLRQEANNAKIDKNNVPRSSKEHP